MIDTTAPPGQECIGASTMRSMSSKEIINAMSSRLLFVAEERETVPDSDVDRRATRWRAMRAA
jgi:hypothetical protein